VVVWGLFVLFGGKLHEIGFDEWVEVAVHDAVDVGCLPVGAVVFDTTVVEDVAAYL
jgi:hypothetical protein